MTTELERQYLGVFRLNRTIYGYERQYFAGDIVLIIEFNKDPTITRELSAWRHITLVTSKGTVDKSHIHLSQFDEFFDRVL